MGIREHTCVWNEMDSGLCFVRCFVLCVFLLDTFGLLPFRTIMYFGEAYFLFIHRFAPPDFISYLRFLFLHSIPFLSLVVLPPMFASSAHFSLFITDSCHARLISYIIFVFGIEWKAHLCAAKGEIGCGRGDHAAAVAYPPLPQTGSSFINMLAWGQHCHISYMGDT